MEKIKQIASKVEILKDIRNMEDIRKYLAPDTEYKVVAWLLPCIAFGSYMNGFKLCEVPELKFEEIDSIRIFSENSELYLYRPWDTSEGMAADTLSGRLRVDGEGETLNCKDARQLLFGSRVEAKNENYAIMREDSGFELKVPAEWVSENATDKSRLILKTRNYLDEWDNGQLSYCDHRFISISEIGKEE